MCSIKGYEPAITDFFIESIEDGWDYTNEILQQPGYTFLLVSYSLDRSSEKNTDRINRLAEWSFNHGIDFISLTASPESQIAEFIDRTGAGYKFYHSDEITLKTIIRSNPGLVLLHQRTILAKWHNRNIPYADELKENLLSYSLELQQDTKNDLITIGYIATLILILTLLKFVRPTINKRFSKTPEAGNL